ncbi:MAG: tetratricopeptide repeat protein, partial [Chloroflexi bacterium]|nr:tetratricopeptide repeat protein [Chloroflexota bacterium]
LANQAHQSGLAYHILGQYDKAIADFNRSIQLQPNINDTAQTYVDRGLAYIGLGQYRSAIQDFDFAIAKARGHFYAGDPMFFPYFFNRGLAYFNLGRYTEAVADLTAALSFKHPDLDEALLIRGISYGLLGQHALAMNDLDEFDKSGVNLVRGLRLNPQVSKVNYTRGLAFLSLGQYQRSIDFFDQAIQLDPDDPVPYISRGLANAHLGRNQQATRDIDQAMEIFEVSLSIVDEDRYSANALFLQGRAYQGLGQADSAIKLLTLAVRLHSNDPQAYINRANAYHDMSRYNEAVSDLDQAISLFQDRRDAAQAYVDRGLANVGLGQYRIAIEDFDEAIDRKQGHFYSGDPVYFPYFFNRGLAYFNLGSYQMAIGNMDSAIGFDHPDIAEAYLIRGISYGLMGQNALADADLLGLGDAATDLERGFRLNPQDSKVYYTRGLTFFYLGRYQQAIDSFDQAIQLDPSDPLLREGRGLAIAKLAQN